MKSHSRVAANGIKFLILGDGDFTFSLDLVQYLKDQRSKERSTKDTASQKPLLTVEATGIDTHTSLVAKYRDASFVLGRIRRLSTVASEDRLRLSVSVKHEVNAVDPSVPGDGDSLQSYPITGADHVLFNHPHLGTEDAALHARFLCHLFHAVVSSWLASDGSFHLTLAKGQYERWKCAEAAQKCGMKLRRRSDFMPPPLANAYYQQRRHQTGKSFLVSKSETLTYTLQETSDMIPLPWWADHGERMEKKQMFTCTECDKAFLEERSLKNHIRSKHGNKRQKPNHEPLPISCPICAKEFLSEHGLKEHRQAKHTALHSDIRPDPKEADRHDNDTSTGKFQCLICGIVMESRDDEALAQHLRQFSPSTSCEQATFQCTFCQRLFRQNRARLQHENMCYSRGSHKA